MNNNIPLKIYELKKLITHLKNGRWIKIFFNDDLVALNATYFRHLRDIKDHKNHN